MKTLELGVCSWSIDRHDVVRAIGLAGETLDLRAVQIGFFTEEAVRTADPDAIVRAAESVKVALTSSFVAFEGEDYSSIATIAETGGYRPDAEYQRRLAMTRRVADLTASVGCKAVAVHAGTIPPDPSLPLYSKLTARVRQVADALTDRGLRLHIETGRESAGLLSTFITTLDRENVAVNFDCGNFVVYGTDDPALAVSKLAGRIENVHLKDALRSVRPGLEFGKPASLGSGDAHVTRVIDELRATGYRGPLLIECPNRDGDPEIVRPAVKYARSLFG